MRHEWEAARKTVAEFLKGAKRRCRNCGKVQYRESKQAWQRVYAYVWRPLAGRCEPMNREKANVGDVVEMNGKLFQAVMYDRCSVLFQVCKKDGTANKGRVLQRLTNYKIVRRAEESSSDGL